MTYIETAKDEKGNTVFNIMNMPMSDLQFIYDGLTFSLQMNQALMQFPALVLGNQEHARLLSQTIINIIRSNRKLLMAPKDELLNQLKKTD
jgi:hypothetical protein